MLRHEKCEDFPQSLTLGPSPGAIQAHGNRSLCQSPAHFDQTEGAPTLSPCHLDASLNKQSVGSDDAVQKLDMQKISQNNVDPASAAHNLVQNAEQMESDAQYSPMMIPSLGPASSDNHTKGHTAIDKLDQSMREMLMSFDAQRDRELAQVRIVTFLETYHSSI
eukprot:SAG31_NODE_2938_length_4883_cov_21.311521_2_plen_164_part_00